MRLEAEPQRVPAVSRSRPRFRAIRYAPPVVRCKPREPELPDRGCAQCRVGPRPQFKRRQSPGRRDHPEGNRNQGEKAMNTNRNMYIAAGALPPPCRSFDGTRKAKGLICAVLSIVT